MVLERNEVRRVIAPRPADFGGLLVLALCWGSSFFFVELALEGFGPLTIAAGRITIAAALLTLLARLRGHRLPHNRRDWFYLIAAGVSGATIPFALIPWGQSQITSSMAAILMAFTPLATVLLAHLMTHDERISPGKIFGIVLGIVGVAVLVGGIDPERIGVNLSGKLAIVLAGIGYALSSLLLRRASVPTLVGAAGVMLPAAATILPVALLFEPVPERLPAPSAIGAVLFLGVFPSAVAVVVLVWLLGRVGATFVSLNNYLVPLVGMLLGIGLLGEPFTAGAALGLVLILAGVLSTQWAQRRQAMQQSRAKPSP